jgi:hypothetical protein
MIFDAINTIVNETGTDIKKVVICAGGICWHLCGKYLL